MKVSEHTHRPPGLNQRQLERLVEHVRRGQLLAPDRLLQAAYAHLEDVQGFHAQNPDVDVVRAESICHVLDRVVTEWESFSPVQQSWMRGAMRYFAKADDDQHDYARDGLEDDLEVLNACLQFVGRQQWIVKSEPGAL